ncbi:MAG: polysaccharide biosynthesis protein [Erysipelotrichaceae bacterium]|nr:polysaccharide biosynthesis protein [Erysipelotrichaceae bacterium]
MAKSRSIVKQASILAIAGILVRIIGLLYRSPLTHLITAEGMGYYSTAYNIYAMILLLSSYSIPTAISKLISEKLVLNQYDNVQKILRCSFIYICVIGGSAALLCFILAPLLVTEYSVTALRVLCPTIFLSGLLGVFRGYFQAHQITIYTSISQIVEQLLNAIVSVGAAWLFIQPYISTGGTQMASVGAAGSALGTGAGVLIGLIYMLCIYLRKHQNLIIKNDADPYTDSYKDIFKMILNIVTPIIFATCIYNIVTTMDMYIFYGVLGDSTEIVTLYGIYSGEYVTLQNVPVALASAMSTASIPAIASAFSIKDYNQVKENIRSGINVTMMILIPAAVGMSVLAYPIMGLLFPQESTIQTATTLLTFGTPAVVFYGLSTLTNGILQALGKVNEPLKNAAISLVINAVITFLLLALTPLKVYGLLLGNILYGLSVCLLNQLSLHKAISYKQYYKTTFLLPLLASAIMGVIVWICYKVLFMLTHMVFVPLMLSIVVGVVVYFLVIFYMSSDHPEYLDAIPYANKIAQRLRH